MKIVKFIAILIFLNLLFVNESIGQISSKDTLNYEIIYDYHYQINKEDTLNIQTEKMVLKTGKNISEYVSYNRILVKEKLKEMAASGNSDMRNMPKAKILYKVIKEYNNKKSYFLNSFGTIKMYYDEPLELMTWTLTNEEKEMIGYVCKKATTTFAGRNYTAWYSKDITIPDGPYKFYGLPGLILSISDNSNHHLMQAVAIKKINEIYNFDTEKHIQVSKTDYLETVKKIKDKPSLMAQTDLMQFPKEMLDKLDINGKIKFKFENNPIELSDK